LIGQPTGPHPGQFLAVIAVRPAGNELGLPLQGEHWLAMEEAAFLLAIFLCPQLHGAGLWRSVKFIASALFETLILTQAMLLSSKL